MIAALSGGCASSEMIGVRPGAAAVSLLQESQVSGCQKKGSITVSVLAKVGFINRSIEDVDANLLQMARNNALDLGGDTIVKGERPEIGKRNFAVYKCRP